MDTATVAVLLAAGTLLLNLGIHIYGGGWNLSATLADMEKSLRKSISEAKDEIEERQDTNIRMIGDSLLALRQKVNDVELDAAKTYMRRDGFYAVKQEIEEAMSQVSDRLEKRLERMETKLDSKT